MAKHRADGHRIVRRIRIVNCVSAWRVINTWIIAVQQAILTPN